MNKNFLDSLGLEEDKLKNFTRSTLAHVEDGELFIENRVSESMVFDDGVLRSSSFDIDRGFGLRGIVGEATAYSFSSNFSDQSFNTSADVIKSFAKSAPKDIKIAVGPANSRRNLYQAVNPIEYVNFNKKLELLQKIDAYVRSKPNVKQVSIAINSNVQEVAIIRPDGFLATDYRPMFVFKVNVVLEKNGRIESNSDGYGGRWVDYNALYNGEKWKEIADKAYNNAEINLESVAAPAGEMPVFLGSGWPGILIHEAVGHGLEADFNRKKTSAFSEMMGKRVAAEFINVVDDGTIKNTRGSINFDDEGTPTTKNILIENGILKSYMYDRLNARLMGKISTGNGRRESYRHAPMPRMTNTYMEGGGDSKENIIADVKDGIYAVNFSGGQVDITNGKFVFVSSLAYKIENGKIKQPLKNVTLIGNGPDALTKVTAIANDSRLDPGIGTCGKDGQLVPVNVGMPSLLIDKMTVGGTSS